MNLPVLYEDDDVVAVDKPSGILVHADGRSEGETAEDWFGKKYPDTVGGYVHRIDRDTSGVLLFAKNTAAYEFFRKAFHDRLVHKTYLAFIYGVPKERKGVIDFDIGRSRKDFRLRSAQPKARGKLREAVTRYEVIGEAIENGEKIAFLELHPETGRTHQIRVHLKAIHHPIVSDPLYAPRKAPMLSFKRLALHAFMLETPLPSGGSTRIIAPLPDDFLAAIRQFPEAERFASAA